MHKLLTPYLLLALIFSFKSFATEQPKGFSQQQEAMMVQENQVQAQQDLLGIGAGFVPSGQNLLYTTDALAFAEYQDAGYLIFSADFNFSSRQAKRTMARHLPDDVTLVVYTWQQSSAAHQRIRQGYRGLIEDERLKVVYLPNAQHGFWSRDGLPIPVWRSNEQEELFTVVDARYYYPFEPDKEIAKLFNSELTNHSYYFEGGNFMANDIGDCLVVNTNATNRIPDSTFLQHYGCQQLIRLPHVRGIGHADEVVKFIDEKTILTDTESYIPTLKTNGFNIVRLPRPKNSLETYVNSLIINDTVYVPTFKQPQTDQQAIKVYESLGLKAVGIDSRILSNNGQGSLHCITMTYPPVSFQKLKKMLGAQ